MANITKESIVQRNENRVITTKLGDELVMMDIEKGTYICVNRTGTVIWQNIEKPIKVADLIAGLNNMYKTEESLCAADTLEYLETLLAEKIISLL
ncbi:hypothetical protein DYBT9275_03889 [Dyadobacter sp. CECT 9275]|uniref:PqqD family protein n=1 Tax=Dyadobacter helix TaxID=2822344 RepID=A0A916JEA7_9BACT|nr:PqqD family protein [Dyadobacter sp. CECT 9275]CAG5006753.1 hypothetical protein DYBT9275_03889 [Dyadobacter sp. CECT 9275]